MERPASAGFSLAALQAGTGSKGSTDYAMPPHWAKAELAMLHAGKAFNAQLVASLK